MYSNIVCIFYFFESSEMAVLGASLLDSESIRDGRIGRIFVDSESIRDGHVGRIFGG